MNHFASMYRSSQHASSHIRHVDDPDANEPNMVFTVGSSGTFKTCELLIADTPTCLLIDLGAKVSILNDTEYKSHFAKYRLQPATTTLHAYSDSRIEVLGTISVPVR